MDELQNCGAHKPCTTQTHVMYDENIFVPPEAQHHQSQEEDPVRKKSEATTIKSSSSYGGIPDFFKISRESNEMMDCISPIKDYLTPNKETLPHPSYTTEEDFRQARNSSA